MVEALHDEIARLPGSFRLPVVLCYFEGLTLDEAAHQLHWPAGTVRSRLARARDKLRHALTRRGVALPAAVLATSLGTKSASSRISFPRCDITTKAAIQFAAGQVPSSLATSLAREMLGAMLIHKLRFTIVIVFALAAFVGTGAGFLTHSLAMKDEPRRTRAASQPPLAAKPHDPAPDRMFVVGRVLDPQGKPVPNAMTMVYAQTKVPGFTGGFNKRFPSAIGQARSDGSGRFRLDATRTSSSTHSRIGATAIAFGYGVGWADLDPDVDQPTAEIALRPEQVIQGRLFDLQGQPAQGVTVTVDAMGQVVRRHPLTATDGLEGPIFCWADAKDLPAWPKPATSDREGRFTVHGVGRDIRAVLVVDDPRFAAQRTAVDTDEASASKPLTLALEPAKSLTGRVTYSDTGKPAAHAQVTALSYKGSAGPNMLGHNIIDVEVDAEGRFRVPTLSADQLSIVAFAPKGQPYRSAGKIFDIFDWPKGAIQHSLELSLVRGIAIRGTVTEEGSGKPVAGAMVDLVSHDTTSEGGQPLSETGHDGSFLLATRPGSGYLVVRGPSDDYVLREVGKNMMFDGRPGGPRTYAHAFIACDVKPDSEGLEVHAVLRRGVILKGRVIGPDDQPVRDAQMIARLYPEPTLRSWSFWLGTDHGRVLDGRFELHGLDPDTEVPIHFFDPKHKLGATVRVSGKLAAGGPIHVRLEPCGTAKVRFVDPDGKPVADYPLIISMIVTPGAYRGSEEDKEGHLLADAGALSLIAPLNYDETSPVSDAQGRISLPALIPGATYRVGTPRSKEFTVKPGETLDLGDIPIAKPQS
jgi:hypothetical protein